jgi:hypothetical protein
VEDVAKAVSLGPDRELLHFIPQEYRVDGQGGISDPAGMTGLRLEVDMYLVSIQSTAVQNVRRAVERAGFRVAGLVLEPLATSLAVLTEEERELGCVLVELGGGSTNLAVFKDGKIRHFASLRFAGSHVTNDIVQGLSVTQADAERLKERFGVAFTPLVDPDETIELPAPGRGPGAPSVSCWRTSSRSGWTRSWDWCSRTWTRQLREPLAGGRDPHRRVRSWRGPGTGARGARHAGRTGIPNRGVTGSGAACAPRYAVPVGLAWAARSDWRVSETTVSVEVAGARAAMAAGLLLMQTRGDA